MSSVFNQVANEQLHNASVQKYKFNYSYSVSATIEAGTTTPFILAIEQDADFLIEKMTGSCYGPCDASGTPVAGATDFPMPGIAIGAGFAGRGLSVQITDTGSSRALTSGAIPVETILTPGYGRQMYLPFPMKYFAARNSKIRFDFMNRDTQARHKVDIVLNGYKYMMPEPSSNLNPTGGIINNSQIAM
jgi:hypothetical protein